MSNPRAVSVPAPNPLYLINAILDTVNETNEKIVIQRLDAAFNQHKHVNRQAANQDNQTPLLVAAKEHHYFALKWLLTGVLAKYRRKVDINHVDNDGLNALSYAVGYFDDNDGAVTPDILRKRACIALLLSCKIDIYNSNFSLCGAAFFGNLYFIKLFLSNYKMDMAFILQAEIFQYATTGGYPNILAFLSQQFPTFFETNNDPLSEEYHIHNRLMSSVIGLFHEKSPQAIAIKDFLIGKGLQFRQQHLHEAASSIDIIKMLLQHGVTYSGNTSKAVLAFLQTHDAIVHANPQRLKASLTDVTAENKNDLVELVKGNEAQLALLNSAIHPVPTPSPTPQPGEPGEIILEIKKDNDYDCEVNNSPLPINVQKSGEKDNERQIEGQPHPSISTSLCREVRRPAAYPRDLAILESLDLADKPWDYGCVHNPTPTPIPEPVITRQEEIMIARRWIAEINTQPISSWRNFLFHKADLPHPADQVAPAPLPKDNKPARNSCWL